MKNLKKLLSFILIVGISIFCFACGDKGSTEEVVKAYKPVEIKSVTNVNNDEEICLYYGIEGMNSYDLNFVFDPAEASYKDLDVSITGDNVNIVEIVEGKIIAKKLDGTVLVTFSAKKGSFNEEFTVKVVDAESHPELLLFKGMKSGELNLNWNGEEALEIKSIRPTTVASDTMIFEFKSSEIENVTFSDLDSTKSLSLLESEGTDGYNKKLAVSENGFCINKVSTLNVGDEITIKVSYNYYTGANANNNQQVLISITIVE